MLHDFDTGDHLSSRRDDVVPEDERTVSHLMVDQIEFADIIVVNKVATVSEDTLKRIRACLNGLNPRAKVIETNYGKVDIPKILNTEIFDLSRAQTGAGWLQDIHEMFEREV